MKTILASAVALSIMAPASFARIRQIQFLSLYRHALAERLLVQLSRRIAPTSLHLITVKVSNDYGGYYFKQVWKDIKVCY